jgi:hypothetical protein
MTENRGGEADDRWKHIVDKCIPRVDILDIAWENVPAAWEPEMAALRVCPSCSLNT